jgi:CBS domain-containing protein
MKIQDAMTHTVSVCNQDDPLNDAAQIMWEHDCGSVPVVDGNGAVCGMVTDRDICMAAYIRGLPIHAIAVRDVMSKLVHTCSPGDSIESALALMKRNKVRRMPVTEHGRVVGMLSLSDLLTVLRSSAHGRKNEEPHTAALLETLIFISQPTVGERAGERDPALLDGGSRKRLVEAPRN